MHDAFIVRYDAERDMSVCLPAHCDTSAVSFTLALNRPSKAPRAEKGDKDKEEDKSKEEGEKGEKEKEDEGEEEGEFDGGGTWFEALAPNGEDRSRPNNSQGMKGGSVVGCDEGQVLSILSYNTLPLALNYLLFHGTVWW